PQSAIVSRRPQFFDDHPLIERNLFGADDLVRLVPLAREQQRVSGARQLETEGDGPAAIDLAVVGLRSHARLHGVEDFLGILGARVVRRGDSDVGEARAHLAHGRALATLKRPSNGSRTAAPPIGVASSKRAPWASRVTRRAVTSPLRSPNVTRRCSRRSRPQAGSSAFTTSRPSAARYCASFALARKYASRVLW